MDDVRGLRAAILLPALWFLACDASLAQPSATLRKVTKVAIDIENLTGSDLGFATSESRLRTLLEGKLKSAGLRVLSKSEDANDKAVNPVVRLEVTAVGVRPQGGAVEAGAYRVELSMLQLGRVPLNGASAPVELWREGNVGFDRKEGLGDSIDGVVAQEADRLVARWRADNAGAR